MSNQNDHPTGLLEAVRYFSDLDVCHQYMVRIKWPDGVVRCPKCGTEQVGEIKSRRMFQCKSVACRKQFSTKVGTIFEDSPLGLDKWFVAVWCIVNAKNGISSHELGRALDIQQRSAWHMLHRVRLAMQAKSFHKQLKGEIEGDETLIGGRVHNVHKSRRMVRKDKKGRRMGMGPAAGKMIVQGLLERGGEVRAMTVPNVKSYTIQRNVRKHVEKGAAVFTDTSKSYEGLDYAYVHEMIDHSKTYVEGRVHTNGLENFWSLLKRTLQGTYVAVAPFHLGRYLDEQVFRFNKRKGNDGSRFLEAMMSVCGKRLTYAELTGSSAAAG